MHLGRGANVTLRIQLLYQGGIYMPLHFSYEEFPLPNAREAAVQGCCSRIRSQPIDRNGPESSNRYSLLCEGTQSWFVIGKSNTLARILACIWNSRFRSCVMASSRRHPAV